MQFLASIPMGISQHPRGARLGGSATSPAERASTGGTLGEHWEGSGIA